MQYIPLDCIRAKIRPLTKTRFTIITRLSANQSVRFLNIIFREIHTEQNIIFENYINKMTFTKLDFKYYVNNITTNCFITYSLIYLLQLKLQEFSQVVLDEYRASQEKQQLNLEVFDPTMI